jgi:Surface antigen variable number repeat
MKNSLISKRISIFFISELCKEPTTPHPPVALPVYTVLFFVMTTPSAHASRCLPHSAWLLLFTCLVLILPPPLFAAEDAPQIASIRIEGLRRTRESVIINLIEIRPGDPVTEGLESEIEARLIKSGLFADVAVSLVHGKNRNLDDPAFGSVDLIIVLDEKWTLVPIPYFSSDGDEFSGGLILLESNLLGWNKQLISAGFGGTAGFSGFFLYLDPSLFGSNWSLSLSTGSGTAETENLRPDGELVRKLNLTQQNAAFGIGYRLSPEVRARMRLAVATWQIDEFTPGLDTTEIEDGNYIEPAIQLRYDATRPLDVLLVGPEAEISARGVSSQGGWEVSGRGSFSFPLFKNHRLRLAGSGGYGEMPPLAEQQISGRDGYRTLPYQAVSADRWSSAAVFYDLPVASAGWGALVLSQYWEGGIYDTEVLQPQLFYGPGGGFRVYIRKIAIPALGLDVAYNMADPDWVFSFTVGMRM